MFDVAHLAHVELLTPDPDGSAKFFTEILAMEETGRSGESIYLRAFEEGYHHSLKLTGADRAGLGHIGWRTTSQAALERRGTALAATPRGRGWSDGDVGHGPAYQFTTPDGHLTEVFFEVTYADISDAEQTRLLCRPQRRPLHGVPVRRIDHINLLATDVAACNDFLIEQLGFRLREQIVRGDGELRGVWLSVTALAHDIAVMQDGLGEPGRLHHLCYWYGTAQHLEDVADVLRDRDIVVEHGPGVHGATHAKFLYVIEPGGNRIEFFGDTGRLVFDPTAPVITWDQDHADVAGSWIGSPAPDPDFYLYATPVVPIPDDLVRTSQVGPRLTQERHSG
ncbi:MAG TPA: VOC family protein [Solirubrobacteraceae bacterium]|nr:VOC family protein [Solirubrobacteraceae bacterium]